MLLVKGLFCGRSITGRQVIPYHERIEHMPDARLYYDIGLITHAQIYAPSTDSEYSRQVYPWLRSYYAASLFGTSFDCASEKCASGLLPALPPSGILYTHPVKSPASLKHARQIGLQTLVFGNADELDSWMPPFRMLEFFLGLPLMILLRLSNWAISSARHWNWAYI